MGEKSKPDLFTLRRLQKLVQETARTMGQLATVRDIEKGGFDASDIQAALKKKLIQELYVTLTTGAVMKEYKA